MERDMTSQMQCLVEVVEPCLPLSMSSPLQGNTRRKRDIDEFITPSSDPPMFSSDDMPATAETYLQPNTNFKRQRSGPWYNHGGIVALREQHGVAGRHRRRRLQRDLDSGVWMGSDETEEIEQELCLQKDIQNYSSNTAFSSLRSIQIPPTRGSEDSNTLLFTMAAEYFEDPGLQHGPVFPYWQEQPQDLEAFHRAQRKACAMVETFADSDQRILDLSGLDLQRLLPSTIQPLHFLTRQISSSQDEDYEQIYRPLELYLSHNKLAVVPGELFELEQLKALSLRANKLEEISPALSRLELLEELNLSNNNLHWLPFEILELLAHRVERFTAALNPFILPEDRNHEEFMFDTGQYRSFPYAICRTPVVYLSKDGFAVQGCTPAPSRTFNFQPRRTTMMEPPLTERTRVPSLLELALRSAYASRNLSQLPYFLPASCPASIAQLLKRAWYIKSAGGQTCTVCSKEYVIPRTEWVEWWSCLKNWHDLSRPQASKRTIKPYIGYTVFPFLRRGCSWACTPAESPGERKIAVVSGWTAT